MSVPLTIWPAGSVRSRAARWASVALLFALSVCSQGTNILLFPGTNAYYGMVGGYGTAAYSLIENGTIAGRAGDLRAIKGFVRASDIQAQDYVPPADLLPSLEKTKPGDAMFSYPPGYPLFLAATYLAEGEYRYDLARSIQIFLNMFAAPLLLLLTGIWLGSFGTGYAAAALYVLFGGPAQQTFYILPDALMPFVATLVLATAVWCVRTDRLRRYLLLGVVIGLGANLRTDVLGMTPFLALGIWQARRRLDRGTFLRIGAIAAVSFLLLVPYGLIQKNYPRVARFRITTPGLGQNLWEAYGETPNPHGAVADDAAVDEMLTKHGLHIHLPDGEAYLKKEWLRAALRDPRWFAWSVWNRDKVLLGYWRDGAKIGFTVTNESKFQHAVIGGLRRSFDLVFLAVLFFAVFALIFSRMGFLLAAAPLSYFVAFSLLHIERRYVIPALGPLVFLGCHGAEILLKRLALRRSTTAMAGTAPSGVPAMRAD